MKIKLIIISLVLGVIIALALCVEKTEGRITPNISSQAFSRSNTIVKAIVIPEPEYLKDVYLNIDVKAKIIEFSKLYNVNTVTALRIAECESAFNQYAKNKRSSAKGVYQWLDGTWKAIGAKGHQFDAEENIKQFMINYPKHPDWWECK